MLTKIQVWKKLNEMGVNKSLAEIDAVLSQIDQQAILNEIIQNRFRIEVWDKQSPINGVPAEKIIARDDVLDDGEVYLVYVDGNLIYLQPHDPFQAGIVAMTSENVMEIAQRHVEQIATQYADEQVFEMVLEQLL
ncbi:hypothetical protein [Parageobacillus thermoglucosidasius]|uniref:hypothetical protein n=1 Tax=Parageobacillus thermoglucosidasius TaxID=1426 RepID=UPI00025B7B9F|nr:hypothetical protein [Parageobacillus thermoglucosidasius]EID42845.1 hypothetical protein GT20_2958 [Parageobacillus thermoglucosidasius TNO-09.020]KYD17844.1 hypothetical protein B4168_2405 [Anoxybacillus flavithermus]OAO85375.1 hypothetical protein GT23_3066 [Parageobacillus thermoglucosidasius]